MALTLAKYFNGEGNLEKQTNNAFHVVPFVEKNFWGKDLIFLITSHEEIGMQAWIDGYMGTDTSGKKCSFSKPNKKREEAIEAICEAEKKNKK